MTENGKIYELLKVIFKNPNYWVILLALRNGPRTGMTYEDIEKSIEELGSSIRPDNVWICVTSELENLKKDGLVENQINDREKKFKPTFTGRKAAKIAKELIDKLISSKKQAEMAG